MRTCHYLKWIGVVMQLPLLRIDQLVNTPISQTLSRLKGFKLAHLNVASVPNHLDELKALMVKKNSGYI